MTGGPPRKVALTDVGTRVLDAARDALAAADRVAAAALAAAKLKRAFGGRCAECKENEERRVNGVENALRAITHFPAGTMNSRR